jgi:hypothetical protein
MQNDIPAFATIPSVRSAFRDKCLSPEAQATISTFAGNNFNTRLIYEFQLSAFRPAG